MMADVAVSSRPEQITSMSSEPQVRTIWESLLEPNILRYGSRYLKDEDECAINMVLQVIHTKFKALLKQTRRLQEENTHFQEQLEKRQEQVIELEKKLSKVDEKRTCNSCKKKEEELEQERGKYRTLEEKMKLCASLMNTMVNKDEDDSKTSSGSELVLARNTSSSTVSTSTMESPLPVKKSLKLSRRQLGWHTESKASDSDVIVPDTPDKAGTSEESSLEKTTICVPETVPFDFADQMEGVGGRRMRLRKPSMPSPIMDCISTKTDFTPTKPAAPLSSLLSSTKVESATPSHVQEELDGSSCYSPPIFTTTSRRPEDVLAAPAAATGGDDSDDDFRSFSRKKGMFDRVQTKPAIKSKVKSRQLSLNSKSQSLEKVPDPPIEKEQSEHIKSSQIPSSAANPEPREPCTDDQPGPSNAASAYVEEPMEREAKRRRRIKGPEDWPCGECRRLLYESKIDIKKLKPSMNFCPEHRNRMSYYLNTPPGFWNPVIVGSPRRRRATPSQEEIE